MINIEIDADQLVKTLAILEDKLAAVEPYVWDSIADILLQSVSENFQISGRPEAWLSSQRVMKYGGKTLVKSGALMASGLVAERTENAIAVSWGAGLEYAKIHQFGGTIMHPRMRKSVLKSGKKGKLKAVEGGEYPIDIPARPYVMFQPEDIDKIVLTFQDYYSSQPS